MTDPKAWIEETHTLSSGEYTVAVRTALRRIPRALKALSAVLELHAKETGGTPDGEIADVCSCGVSYWPCATVQAIESAVEVGK